MISTGIRIGEICALTWDDIDTENGVIHIRKTIQRIYIRENGIRHTELMIDTPKTATSIRDIPMTKDLLSVLKPLRKVVNEFVFCAYKRFNADRTAHVSELLQKIACKIGYPADKISRFTP